MQNVHVAVNVILQQIESEKRFGMPSYIYCVYVNVFINSQYATTINI